MLHPWTVPPWRVLLVAGVGLALAACAANAPPPAAPGSSYADRERRFEIAVPAGIQVSEDVSGRRAVFRAGNEYAITIQWSPASPVSGLGDMLRRLEALHYGPGKNWTRKREERGLRIAGLPAVDAAYEGVESFARVTIVRGAATDFVLMFLTTEQGFRKHESVYDRLLGSFTPGHGETAAVRPSGGPASRAQRFADPTLGYAIDYPAEWTVERVGEFTITISGRGPSGPAVLRIQNISPANARNADQAVGEVLERLRARLVAAAPGAYFLGEDAFLYDADGVALRGRQFVVAYSDQGKPHRQWTVVLPRAAGTVVHVWSFGGETEPFAALRPVAERMLASWVLDADRDAPGPSR